jgi:hypothetical protein
MGLSLCVAWTPRVSVIIFLPPSLSAAPVRVRAARGHDALTGMVPPHLTGLYGGVNSRSMEARGSMGIASSRSGSFSMPSIQVSRLRLPSVLSPLLTGFRGVLPMHRRVPLPPSIRIW